MDSEVFILKVDKNKSPLFRALKYGFMDGEGERIFARKAKDGEIPKIDFVFGKFRKPLQWGQYLEIGYLDTPSGRAWVFVRA